MKRTSSPLATSHTKLSGHTHKSWRGSPKWLTTTLDLLVCAKSTTHLHWSATVPIKIWRNNMFHRDWFGTMNRNWPTLSRTMVMKLWLLRSIIHLLVLSSTPCVVSIKWTLIVSNFYWGKDRCSCFLCDDRWGTGREIPTVHHSVLPWSWWAAFNSP